LEKNQISLAAFDTIAPY